ncbi:RM10 protein, partial [Anthoscopus minutus]|nr:RM10 protein [Anthoscopus minutus]
AAKMAALGGGGTRWRRAWLPALQLLRRGSKAVTRHWKAMHFQRQKLLAVTEYLPPRPAVPPRCLPRRSPERHEEDGQARVLRRQLEQALGDSRMVAVCHYCPMPDEDVAVLRHFLRKHDIHVKFVLNEVGLGSGHEIEGWGLNYSTAPTQTGVGSLQGRAVPSQRALGSQPIPSSPFPGACIDNTILSRQGVENFARLPSLEVSQGQTVAALSLLPSQTCSLLQQGPAHLTALLDEHIRQLQGSGAATEPPQG